VYHGRFALSSIIFEIIFEISGKTQKSLITPITKPVKAKKNLLIIFWNLCNQESE